MRNLIIVLLFLSFLLVPTHANDVTVAPAKKNIYVNLTESQETTIDGYSVFVENECS